MTGSLFVCIFWFNLKLWHFDIWLLIWQYKHFFSSYNILKVNVNFCTSLRLLCIFTKLRNNYKNKGDKRLIIFIRTQTGSTFLMIIFLLSVCDGSGYYFPDSDNDCMYWQCTAAGDAHHKSCHKGLIWNNRRRTCTWPAFGATYDCDEGQLVSFNIFTEKNCAKFHSSLIILV